jgi:hypothetical protein
MFLANSINYVAEVMRKRTLPHIVYTCQDRLLSSGFVAHQMAGCPPTGAQHLVENTSLQFEGRYRSGRRLVQENQIKVVLIPIAGTVTTDRM